MSDTERTTRDNAVRGRLNAYFLSKIEPMMENMFGEDKRRLFAELGPRVVEIGPGAGANLPYYPEGLELIGIEPSVHMQARLRAKAEALGVPMEVRGLKGEAIDVPDESVDAVVATLLLCSVEDPAAVVREAMRVLRPGGKYVFIEHVAAPPRSPLRLAQALFFRPHKWLFEGCHTNRETGKILEAAGFSDLNYTRDNKWSIMFYVAPIISGYGIKSV